MKELEKHTKETGIQESFHVQEAFGKTWAGEPQPPRSLEDKYHVLQTQATVGTPRQLPEPTLDLTPGGVAGRAVEGAEGRVRGWGSGDRRTHHA